MRAALERLGRAAFACLLILTAALAASSCSRPEPGFRVAVVGFPAGGWEEGRNLIAEYGARRAEGVLGAGVDFILPEEGGDLGYLFDAEGEPYDLVISLGSSSRAVLEARPQGWGGAVVALDFEPSEPVTGEGEVTVVRYRVEEGTYLCGYLAAWLSARGSHPLTNAKPLVAFIGSRDYPLLSYFTSGFDRGVKAGATNADSLDYYLERGDDTKAARALAEEAVKKGADVIFCSPGDFNTEVLKVAAEKGVLVILSGPDRSGESPGHVLTSLVFRDDNAIFEAVREAMDGELSPGKAVWGGEQGTWSLAPYHAHDGYIGRELREALAEQMLKARDMDFSVPSP
ncbi:MAG: BMP family ABC transporter substrate-binding protein [Actinomycetota bacterium]|nr:BMP family ABC transporter substrate-binding protein [Actinomycetota bacterium]